jgi:hypothetical protein
VSRAKDAVVYAVLLLIAASIVVTVVVEVRGCRIERACLAAGYPSHRASLVKGDYCVKRVDQSDVVVPFDMAVSP